MQRLEDWWWQLSRRQQLLLGSVALVLVGLGLWGFWPREASTTLPAAPPPPTTGMAQTSTHPSATSASTPVVSHDTRVFVDVQGAVKHPGLYQFAQGMRVADALKAAGGLVVRADRQQVNLAMRLTDQQQLYIPLKGEHHTATPPATGNSTATSQASSAATVVNLNTATVSDLQQLTGVGAKKAQKIVDYRTEHGAFKSVKDLTQVAGFGEKTVEHLQDQLTT